MLNMKRIAALLISMAVWTPHTVLAQSLDFDALADVLVQKLDPQPHEHVMLVAMPGRFDPLVDALAAGISNTGAQYLGTWSVSGSGPEHWKTEDLKEYSDGYMASALAQLDASIMLPGANEGHRIYAEIQQDLGEGRGRTIHFHWDGVYDLDGNVVEVDEDIDRLYESTVIHTDYGALARAQQQFEDAMRGSTIRVTTPSGTAISFMIGNRPVNRQDGDASEAGTDGPILIDREIELPAGAIRVAPLENTVQGTIVFPRSYWQGTLVTNLRMTFEDGIADVDGISAETGRDNVLQEINEAGLAGRSFREFALGFNPCIPVQTGSRTFIPYYGYGSGVVRLSLGDNSELGGNVGGAYVRWNFFTDATVTVDGQPWVPAGDCPASTSPGKPAPPDLIG